MADFQSISNARAAEMASHSGDMARMLLALNKRIHFVIKELKTSQVPEKRLSKSCRLVMPAWFVMEYTDKLHQIVVLRSGISTAPHAVQLNVACTSAGKPVIKFGKGWRDFAKLNKLLVGDSLIFELKGISEFFVHIFRRNQKPNAVSSSHASKKCSMDSDLISQKNENYDSSGGCASHHHVADQTTGGSADGLSCWIAKTREIEEAEGVASAARSILQISSRINSHQVSEVEDVQMSSVEQHRTGIPHSQQRPVDNQDQLKIPLSRPHDNAQDFSGARQIHVKSEFQQPIKVSLPSFIQRLVVYNVQDSVGNTCGAFLEVPHNFVRTHGMQLQAPHVHLQGIRKQSPVRPVTACFHSMQKDGDLFVRPLLRLGWGDFVRENGLRTGQELVFTLAAESFFIVREVSHEVVI